MTIFSLFNFELAAVKLRARNKFLQTCYRQRCQITSENTKCEQFILMTCGNQVKSKKQNFCRLATDKDFRSLLKYKMLTIYPFLSQNVLHYDRTALHIINMKINFEATLN